VRNGTKFPLLGKRGTPRRHGSIGSDAQICRVSRPGKGSHCEADTFVAGRYRARNYGAFDIYALGVFGWCAGSKLRDSNAGFRLSGYSTTRSSATFSQRMNGQTRQGGVSAIPPALAPSHDSRLVPIWRIRAAVLRNERRALFTPLCVTLSLALWRGGTRLSR